MISRRGRICYISIMVTQKTILAGLALATVLAVPTLASAQSCSPARGQSGTFDYYVLSLSWSPAFCASPAGARASEQCGLTAPRRGFVVHGLWPQYQAGSAAQQEARGLWPQCCRGAAFDPAAVPPSLDGVMIGEELRRHEWSKHGTCATPRPAPYFASIASAVEKVGLARDVPPNAGRIRISDLKSHFPVPAAALFPTCQGKALKEVRICLDRSLNPLPCPPETRRDDNCPGTVTLK